MIQLLNRNSLSVSNTFMAEKMALNLSERQSTATITIGPEAPVLTVGDWLRDTENPGAGIVWRIKSIDTDYATDTRTVNCEHMINSLRDRIMFGEVTPAKITGNKKAEECTVAQAVRYVLGKQSDWVLGSLGYSKSNPYSFNGDDLFSAMETISTNLLDAWWSYDFSAYPFKLTIAKKETAVSCEMRMDRNIKTLKKTIDRSRMFTRFYPIGKNNLKLSSKYISKNENLYGVICKVETDQSKGTEKKLKNWANERLNNHAEPLVTVTISGLELSAATGEPLDRLTLGKVCRVPLPEFSTTITERITKLSWGDKIADPESVTVTLANEYQDLASIINNIQKSTSSGGRAGAQNSEEDHAWITDTTEKVEIVAEAIAGKDGNGADWSRVSRLTVDGNGIDLRVTKTEDGLATCESNISLLEDRIDIEVQERKDGDTSLSGKITVEAGRISQIVSAVGANGKVTAASIVLAVNNSGSSVHINADKIYLLGTTIANTITADYIGTKIASLATVNVKRLTSEQGGIDVKSVSADTYYHGGVTCYLAHAVTSLRITGPTNNVYTLQRKWFSNDDWVDVGTFSRATSLSGDWSGRNFTVTASPQGNTCTGIVYNGLVNSGSVTTSTSGNNHYVKQDVIVYSDDGNGDADKVIMTKSVSILANDVYTDGKKAATVSLNHGTVTADSNYQKYVTYTATNDSNTQKKAEKVLYLVKSSNKAQLREGSASGTLVMEINTT